MLLISMSLIANLVISCIIAYIASHKGRSAAGWFFSSLFAGFFFNANIILLIVILVTADLNEEQARLAHEGAWRRRHQDTFTQERQVNRQFRDHVIKRLDRQDEALGLEPVEDRPKEMPQPPKEIIAYPVLGNGSWFLVINNKEHGPVPEVKVIEMLEAGEIDREVYAWSEGMQDWQRARTIGNFSADC